MFGRLLVLFIGVPLLELALLVGIGRRVGLVPTVALVVLTGILGAALARWQGLSALARLQAALAEGRPPAMEVLEGLLILIAAAVLLTPGLLTDLAGFALLVPPVRRWAMKRAGGWLQRRFHTGAAAAGAGGTQVVDVDFTVQPERRLENEDR